MRCRNVTLCNDKVYTSSYWTCVCVGERDSEVWGGGGVGGRT